MSQTCALVKRNIKLFFKDKGMFFTSLITPAILLVLYITFLGGVYEESFTASLPDTLQLSEGVVNALVGGQLVSSILAVSCVTVAFCSNFLMVQDKAGGAINDLKISPVKPAALSMGYYAATLISTLLICFAALGLCLLYLSLVGWTLSAADILLLVLASLAACVVWNGAFLYHQFFLVYTGANLCGGRHHQRRIWLHQRGVYADFLF